MIKMIFEMKKYNQEDKQQNIHKEKKTLFDHYEG